MTEKEYLKDLQDLDPKWRICFLPDDVWRVFDTLLEITPQAEGLYGLTNKGILNYVIDLNILLPYDGEEVKINGKVDKGFRDTEAYKKLKVLSKDRSDRFNEIVEVMRRAQQEEIKRQNEERKEVS